MVQKVLPGQNIQDQEQMDRSDEFPRCSTPVSDPRRGPQRTFFMHTSDPSDLYGAWKKRLHYPRTNNIKIRGMGSRQTCEDTSIISGHFDDHPRERSSSVNQSPIETKATPMYQMWYPYGVPGLFQPQMVYPAPTTCPCQKPMCFAMPVQMQSVTPVPQMAPVHQVMQPMQPQVPHWTPPPPPMRHMYYEYPAFMPHPQQTSYYNSVGSYGNTGNGAFMVPLMMAGKV